MCASHNDIADGKRCAPKAQRYYGLSRKRFYFQIISFNIICEVKIMKEDKLTELSMKLSVDVIKLANELKNKHETIVSNQLARSATSVCANIAESKYGHSRADFIAKMEIALKETNETSKWLEILFKTDYIDEKTLREIEKTCSTIRILLIASCKTAKKNDKKV